MTEKDIMSEDEVIEAREVDVVLDRHRIGLAGINGAEERERTNGLGHALLDSFDARDERRADCAKSAEEYADAPGRGARGRPAVGHSRFRDVISAATTRPRAESTIIVVRPSSEQK